MKGRRQSRRPNLVARAVKRLRPKVVRPKRGKGSYRRKDGRSQPRERQDDEARPTGRR